jgi:hypothetical protein
MEASHPELVIVVPGEANQPVFLRFADHASVAQDDEFER